MSGGQQAGRKSARCCHARDPLGNPLSEERESLQSAVNRGKCLNLYVIVLTVCIYENMNYKPVKYETAHFTL